MTHRRAIELLIEARVFCPAVVPEFYPDQSGIQAYLVFSAMKVLGRGDTISAAIDDARRNGYISGNVERKPPFRGDGKQVIREGELVATASSRTMADRISNALNQYQPNERGI